jgi:hypothetical protein
VFKCPLVRRGGGVLVSSLYVSTGINACFAIYGDIKKTLQHVEKK